MNGVNARLEILIISQRDSRRSHSTVFIGVSLIRECHLDRFSSDLLYLTRKLAHLRKFLLICWRHLYGQQMSQRVYCKMDTLLPRLRL